MTKYPSLAQIVGIASIDSAYELVEEILPHQQKALPYNIKSV